MSHQGCDGHLNPGDGSTPSDIRVHDVGFRPKAGNLAAQERTSKLAKGDMQPVQIGSRVKGAYVLDVSDIDYGPQSHLT